MPVVKQLLFISCILLAACSRNAEPENKTNTQVDFENILASANSKEAFLSRNQIGLTLLSIKYRISLSAAEGIAWEFHEKHGNRPIDDKYFDAARNGKLDQYLKDQMKVIDIPATIHELGVKYSVGEETIAALIWDLRTAETTKTNSN